MAKCGHAGEKKPHCKKTNKTNYHLKLCTFFCLPCPSATFALRHGSFEPHECRAVAWFFPTGGIIASAEGLRLLGGSGVIPPPPRQKKIQIWRLQNAIFSTCHEICLQKSTSNKCEKASVFSANILYKCLLPRSC